MAYHHIARTFFNNLSDTTCKYNLYILNIVNISIIIGLLYRIIILIVLHSTPESYFLSVSCKVLTQYFITIIIISIQFYTADFTIPIE